MSSTQIERNAVVAQLSPQLGTNTTLQTTYADLSLTDTVTFYFQIGNASATSYSASVFQAKTDQGGQAEEIEVLGSEEYDSGDDGKIIIIGVRADRLKANDGFRYVNGRLAISSGGSGNHVSVIALAGNPRYQPVDHIAAVIETVE